MISIEKMGICKDCEYEDLEYYAYDLGMPKGIHCSHEDACKRIEEMFTKKDGTKDETGD